MKYLWLLWLPTLYLPSLSLTSNTGLGTLELSDFFIAPLLILLYLRVQDNWLERLKPKSRIYAHYIIPILLLFLWWAFVSSISLGLRYGYSDLYYVKFSVLKVAKIFLYGLTSVFIMFALAKASPREYQGFLWSFLLCGVLVGGGLFITGNGNASGFTDNTQNAEGLFKDNGVSVMLSIITSFLIGTLVTGHGTRLWRWVASFGLILIILGFVSARGRGGWIAAILALTFIAANINIKQTIRVVIAAVLLVSFAYNNNTTFKGEVDKTLRPNATKESQALGFDDGARLGILELQVPLILDDPIFGRGLFHRSGSSGIFSTGSHNMFLQMFLELGIPGGLLTILLIRQMWIAASTDYVKKNKLDVPAKAAIIAATFSGLSGEYFYGGMVLFSLFLTYASVGRLKRDEEDSRFEHAI